MLQQILGEHECKVDAKGRVRVPSQILKQLGELDSYHFVVNRGMDKHLNLFPKSTWDVLSAKVQKLNKFVRKNMQFIRFFFRGATPVNTDSSDRILLPKSLLEYAGIGKEVVLFAHSDRVEIWAKENYHGFLDEEPENYADIAEEVMGDIDFNDEPPQV